LPQIFVKKIELLDQEESNSPFSTANALTLPIVKVSLLALQSYCKMLKNHMTKANFYWKNLKKAMLGMQYSESTRLSFTTI
jgi:hypothetical protein